MSVYFIKQPSSRPTLTTTTTGVATKAGVMTNQLRVVTTTAGNLSIGDSSSAVSVTVPFAANVAGEYIGIVPGQFYTLGAGMSATEMS
jgi:hypothetical protein